MAIGDAVAGFTVLAANGTWTVRPAAGITWLITGVSSTRWEGGAASPGTYPIIDVYLTDGSWIVKVLDKTETLGHTIPFRYFISNTYYMLIVSRTGGNLQDVCYSGVIANG